MNSWQSQTTNLLSRTSRIFNSEVLSDVTFVVGPQGNEFHAHKLLLSLASPVFEQRFSEHPLENQIKVPEIVPISFYKMLEYIYTDKLELNDVRDAHNVLAVAEKFKIEHLKSLCQNYIRAREVPPHLVCGMYEVATEFQMNSVLKFCHYAFSKHTKDVILSRSFLEAKASTIYDLISSSTSISCKECDVIEAVIKWGRLECYRKGLHLTGNNLRSCINPFIKYLRFLTLSMEEFQPFIEIFTPQEVYDITRRLSGGDYQLKSPPPFLCADTSKRGGEAESKVKSLTPFVSPKKLNNLQLTPEVKSTEKDLKPLSTENTVLRLANTNLPPENEKKQTPVPVPRKYIKNIAAPHFQKNQIIFSDSEDSSEDLSMSRFQTHVNPMKIQKPCLFEMMLDRVTDIPNGIAIKDISSTAVLTMKNGKICITGITIGLKSKEKNDSKQIIVRIEKEDDAYEEVHNTCNIYPESMPITFNMPLYLSANEVGTIKASIFSLQLSRCCVALSTRKTFSDNSAVFDVRLESNQRIFSDSDGHNVFPFLISGIIFNHT